ncbi:MAG: esterase-like activity of phytase family protein [Elainellaceae cyanobacterium]
MHKFIWLVSGQTISLRRWIAGGAIALWVFLSGCSLPRVSAEERIFLTVSLDFLDAYELPNVEFEDTPVRGLSGITYDRARDRIYAVSDDRGDRAPARFYTLTFTVGQTEDNRPCIDGVEVETVTFLLNEMGDTFAPGTVDPEGIAVSPRQSVFISSEGVADDGIPPFIDEFDLETGQWKSRLPVPERYLPRTVDDQAQGVRDNRGFEALTLKAAGFRSGEPFRVFSAIEEPLQQDPLPEEDGQSSPGRILHYVVGDERSLLIAEHLYPIDPEPPGAVINGLVELVALDLGGHFLSLERSFGIFGNGARIFQLAMGGATDTSGMTQFGTNLGRIQPVQKRLLLDLTDLDISLDNLEGMTLGPRLPDGTQSVVLVSDDNFNETQVTQFLLFRLQGVQ